MCLWSCGKCLSTVVLFPVRIEIIISISDGGGSRRRIFLSSAHKETSSTPLHARVPLSFFPRGEVANICYDT